ncbi:hypothetical protein AURDEDRAFT_177980 [Auricularia subglabra TFB-10046 SS5]|uniref:Uncharacterized protein n=1 Tax=Auricularia subglabra (strain TFB-10046 / SS5) TaxID=717982 RepID=J0WLN3_AURST|nr:hypothetical protein AURDEDRAFT_178208 [Auricularia subglabra TFB-10046 SS5]EJD32932.1 hypothetical protein AURDEDRAFT_177980 [Auricularia subglabra TFB-10046 SS5]
MKASLAELSGDLHELISFATQQRTALFAVYESLSEIRQTALAEEKSIGADDKLWWFLPLGSARQRIRDMHDLRRHCVGIRCVVEEAMGTVRRLTASLDALAAATAMSSSQAVRVKITLDALSEAGEVVADAMGALKELLA